MEQWQTYCPRCKTVVLGQRDGANHILHLLLTIFTGGLWLIPWLIIHLINSDKPFRCPYCGSDGYNG